jgi:hypothetical protein
MNKILTAGAMMLMISKANTKASAFVGAMKYGSIHRTMTYINKGIQSG